MDTAVIVAIILFIAIVFIVVIGVVVYYKNIKHQNLVMDTRLSTIQELLGDKTKDSEEDDNDDDRHGRRGETRYMPINVPTREMEEYRQVGVLSSTSTETKKKILPLYGRRTHASSSLWNYYTNTTRNPDLHLPITHRERDCYDNLGCAEINNDDEVLVPSYDETFRVLIYRNRLPRYIPYIHH